MGLVEQREDFWLDPLPEGQLVREVVFLPPELSRYLFVRGMFRLDVKFIQDGKGCLKYDLVSAMNNSFNIMTRRKKEQTK